MSSASKAHGSEFVASMGPTLGPLYDTLDFLALDADAEYLLRVMRAGARAVEAEHAARFAPK